uniref:Uncharacterized protein n=1 Tax=Romanomermis culicivorax TaxID=13658 RepID=A0A915IYM3_ROMCU
MNKNVNVFSGIDISSRLLVTTNAENRQMSVTAADDGQRYARRDMKISGDFVDLDRSVYAAGVATFGRRPFCVRRMMMQKFDEGTITDKSRSVDVLQFSNIFSLIIRLNERRKSRISIHYQSLTTYKVWCDDTNTIRKEFDRVRADGNISFIDSALSAVKYLHFQA